MEKTIHLKLKNLIEPDERYHEIKVGNFIADIKRSNRIFEIQTKNFKLLLDKIEYYINCGFETTIVYPIIRSRYVNWINSNLEVTERRKSPIKGVIQDALLEIYWIHKYLDNPLVSLKIILLDVDELKLLDRTGKNIKYITNKIDKIPTKVIGEVDINNIKDLKVMVPNTLSKEFNTQEFIKATKSRKRGIGSGVKLLRELDIIHVVRKDGKTFIYERSF